MGKLGNKLTLCIGGKTVIQRATEAFFQAGITAVYLVVPGSQIEVFRALLAPWQVTLVVGGTTRQESVYAGLCALPRTAQFVLIHDGARPFVSPALIRRVLATTREYGACFPGVGLSDTVYEAQDGRLSKVLSRGNLVAVQTPQGFRRELIVQAHETAKARGITATDDAALVSAMGGSVVVAEGDPENFKLTTPGDIARFRGPSVTRVGFGMDVHRLMEGRKLVLGGVEIPYSLGLMGHSDADVLIHAVMDALLGAAGLGDIGQHFPDSDECYRDAASLDLLATVVSMLEARGARPLHVDVTLLLEAPKIAPYRDAIKKNLATKLRLSCSQVNIKATTNEGLGYVGEREGAVCYAVATVECSHDDV